MLRSQAELQCTLYTVHSSSASSVSIVGRALHRRRLRVRAPFANTYIHMWIYSIVCPPCARARAGDIEADVQCARERDNVSGTYARRCVVRRSRVVLLYVAYATRFTRYNIAHVHTRL